MHSGAITCEYEVHRMSSSVQKTCPGVDEVPVQIPELFTDMLTSA